MTSFERNMKTPSPHIPSHAAVSPWRRRLPQLVCLAVCFLMMAAAAVQKSRSLLGRQLVAESGAEGPVVTQRADTVIIRSDRLAPDARGFGGPTPVELKLKDNRVVGVRPLPNAETPHFFSRLDAAGLWNRWNGLTPDEAAALRVDAVSGATYSSRSVLQNVAAAAEYAASHQVTETRVWAEVWKRPEVWAALAVALMGAIIPLFTTSRRYRIVQLVLNVAVLGCWTGFCLSYGLLLGWMAGGVEWAAGLVPMVLLFVTLLYPLLGRQGHYCTCLCPLGSLQALCSMASYRHIRPGRRTLRVLTWLRRTLWAALMLLMWCGVGFGWTDYELFAAFLFSNAPLAVAVMAAAVLVLSFFVDRPYCRFICPTGTLLKITQNRF